MTDEELAAYEAELLKYVKKNLRITTDAYDDAELKPLIASAESDIESYTGATFAYTDEKQRMMVVQYVRSHFGDGDDRAEKVYEKEKQKLGLISMGETS